MLRRRAPAARDDLFAVEETGADLTRLTFCNTADAPLRLPRGAFPARRGTARPCGGSTDSNGDGRITAADGESLRDRGPRRGGGRRARARRRARLRRGLVAGRGRSSSTARPARPRTTTSSRWTRNGQNNQNLTSTADVRERRPRFNPSGTSLAFERIDATGRGQIWIVTSLGLRTLITERDGGRGRWPTRRTSWARMPTPTSRRTAGSLRVPAAGRDRQRRPRRVGPHDHPHRRGRCHPGPFVSGGGAYRGARGLETRPASSSRRRSRAAGPQLVFVDADRRGPARATDRGHRLRHRLPALAAVGTSPPR